MLCHVKGWLVADQALQQKQQGGCGNQRGRAWGSEVGTWSPARARACIGWRWGWRWGGAPAPAPWLVWSRGESCSAGGSGSLRGSSHCRTWRTWLQQRGTAIAKPLQRLQSGGDGGAGGNKGGRRGEHMLGAFLAVKRTSMLTCDVLQVRVDSPCAQVARHLIALHPRHGKAGRVSQSLITRRECVGTVQVGCKPPQGK